jgi:cell division protein FtsW (lipid II flippase)
MNKPLQYLKKFDWTLFSAVFLLSCFGLMEIYSIALGREAENLLNFKKQAVFILIGLILFSFFPSLITFFTKLHKIFYTAAAGLLILVLTLGKNCPRNTGWFSIAGFRHSASCIRLK